MFQKNKVIEVKKIKFDKFTIKINLINSAAFSLLGDGNRDKGLHYIPENDLEQLNPDTDQKYTVSVIHHSPEWFCDTSKHILYNYINSFTDLLFVGHEHFSLNENKRVNGKNIDISSGVALYGTNTEHGFNSLVLDTDAHTLIGCKFIFNGKIYKPQRVIDNRNVVFNTNSVFKITNEFQHDLVTDLNEREGENYNAYFVFPSLEVKEVCSDLKNVTVNTEEKFFNLLVEKDKIAIEGESRTGKTILSKYISSKLLDDYTVLYLTAENFNCKKTEYIFNNAIQYEYGDNADCEEFLQLPREKKILVVDDSDRIEKKKRDEFFKVYGDYFGKIITFCGVEWNLNVKDRTIEELTDNAFYRLQICPFYYVKREELIKKICSNYSQDNPLLDVEGKCRKINDDITSQIKYFQLTPDFIHQFVDYYLQFSHIKTHNETNVFSKVFEANITYRISNNIKDEADMDEILVALDYVADYIHFVKQYQRINIQEFEDAVKIYKEQYDNAELNAKYVCDVAVKSSIMKYSSDSFEVEFCDENLLAYFVAQHLNRICQKGIEPEKLQYILDNICFGVNGDIILFLSYITSNTRILSPILHSIKNHMDSWKELNIDQRNIEYLAKTSNPVRIKLPAAEDKQHLKECKNRLEEEIITEKNSQSDSLYSYDISKVNSFSNKISKSIQYLQLVAKVLPNFRHILTGEEKRLITQVLYRYPNKLLYFMLKDIDVNFSKIIEEILKQEPRTRTGLLVTKEMITREVHNQSIAYILSIYDMISTISSNLKTIVDLEKYDFSANTNYRIQNLLMQENVANFSLFAKRAEEIYDDADLNIIKQMVTLIVRKYFMYHNVTLHGDAVHVIDKFFGSDQRNNIQLQQTKNLIVKK